MRTKTITGIFIILVLLFGACEPFQQALGSNGEYTDVVYSMDSSGNTTIELYLDGVGVPMNQTQRAMTLDLAKMSHDFFEVIFVNGALGTVSSPGTGTIARASWEIGQSAGIRGVDRAGTSGVDYERVSQASNGPAAVIFVGRKSDKTLLGIGHLTHVDRVAGTSVTPTSGSVTFTVVALNTKVTAGGDADQAQSGEQPGPLDATNASFITSAGATPSADTTPAHGTTLASWTALDKVEYPMFNLPKPGTGVGDVTQGLYKFQGCLSYEYALADSSNLGLVTAVRNYNDVTTDVKPSIMKRIPRFLSGGQAWEVNTAGWDQATTVDFTSTYAAYTHGNSFVPNVGILFTTKTQSESRIFSFVLQLPVFMVTEVRSTNGGPGAEVWFVRPGFGTTLYNLDNGVDSGGCVLMGVNIEAVDWLNIFTKGIGLD